MDEDKLVTWEMFKLYDKKLKEYIGIPDNKETIINEESKDVQELGEENE